MDYYAHTISTYNDFFLSDLEKLENIIKSGYVLSRRRLGLNSRDALFNGMDYISLCDLSKEHLAYSSYNLYTKRGLSLLFDKKIDVIVPQYVVINKRSLNDIDKMHELGLSGRFSDFMDEVQVKDELSLDFMRALSLSYDAICESHSEEYIKKYLLAVKEILLDYNYHVPIINLDNAKILKNVK